MMSRKILEWAIWMRMKQGDCLHISLESQHGLRILVGLEVFLVNVCWHVTIVLIFTASNGLFICYLLYDWKLQLEIFHVELKCTGTILQILHPHKRLVIWWLFSCFFMCILIQDKIELGIKTLGKSWCWDSLNYVCLNRIVTQPNILELKILRAKNGRTGGSRGLGPTRPVFLCSLYFWTGCNRVDCSSYCFVFFTLCIFSQKNEKHLTYPWTYVTVTELCKICLLFCFLLFSLLFSFPT